MSDLFSPEFTLEKCLEALKIPKEFDTHEEFKTSDLQNELDKWKDIALQVLRRLAETSGASTSSLDPAEIIFYVASFVGDDQWTSLTHNKFALGALFAQLV